MEKYSLQTECLALAQTFEMLWAYYKQSGGQIYSNECRDATLKFIDALIELSVLDKRVLNPKDLRIGEDTDIEDIILHLKEWAAGSSKYPYETVMKSEFMLFGFFGGLKALLFNELNFKRWPPIIYTSEEYAHSSRVIRWSGHLPWAALRNDPDSILKAASEGETIAVVGDIRRSQDLMTYAQDSSDFSHRMVQFITTTRGLIRKHAGIFDKFTGDGFIAYFNSAVCHAAEKNHLECFLEFIKDELSFAAPLFREWSRAIRKRPSANIGLAIGADIGRVIFDDIQNHLVAVGDTIVWASRMASVATGNEVIINNLLFTALDERSELTFAERSGQTKAGEPFLAHTLSFNNQSAREGTQQQIESDGQL